MQWFLGTPSICNWFCIRMPLQCNVCYELSSLARWFTESFIQAIWRLWLSLHLSDPPTDRHYRYPLLLLLLLLHGLTAWLLSWVLFIISRSVTHCGMFSFGAVQLKNCLHVVSMVWAALGYVGSVSVECCRQLSTDLFNCKSGKKQASVLHWSVF